MTRTGIFSRLLGTLALGAAFIAGPAQADDFPSKPISLVVPYAPGGATDILARLINAKLSEMLHQNVLVINKPGAFGIVAMSELMRQPADGYTWLLGNVSTNLLTPILFKDKIPFDYDASIMPVSELADLPGLFAVSTKSIEATTLPDLVAYAKAHPGELRYGTTGIGSFAQFDSEMLDLRAGIKMIHLPIKGGAGDMVNSMANGDIQVAFVNVASGSAMVKAGRLRVLAVVSPARLAAYPDKPTMAEAGYPDVGTTQWQALYLRKGTPQAIVDKVFQVATEAVRSPEVQAAYKNTGYTSVLSASLADAQAFHEKQKLRWLDIIKETGIKVD
jgi:tripartite-type tricarboxylate transporter receptor subunit TctC